MFPLQAALLLLIAPQPVGTDYARNLEVRYALIRPLYGVYEGRRPGPSSAEIARKYVASVQDSFRNSAARVEFDAQRLYDVLIATDSTLGTYLQSTDKDLVRNALAETMMRRRTTSPQALYVLARNQEFATQALPALGAIGDARALGSLRLLLKSPNPEIRVTAAYQLAMNHKSDGAKELWWGLKHPFVKQTWDVQRVAARIAQALLELGEVRSRHQLDLLFSSTGAYGRYLCPLLARTRREMYLQKLRDLLTDSRVYHGVRSWAADALGGIQDRRAIPYLKRAVSDPVLPVSTAALRALERMHR